MSVIECWTMIRRRDWPDDQGHLLNPKGPRPTPDEQLEVFDVVRADAYEGAVDAERERIVALIREWADNADYATMCSWRALADRIVHHAGGQ